MNQDMLNQVSWQIRNDLGTNLYADNFQKVGKSQARYSFDLNLSFPVCHVDSISKQRYVNYLVLKNVAMGNLEKKDNYAVNLPKFNEVNKKVKTHLSALNEESEKIILASSSNKIAKLSEVDHYLKPISFIMGSMFTDDSFENDENIDPRMKKYLSLLSDLTLIEKSDDYYTPDKLLVSIMKKSDNLKEFKENIYAYLLDNAYETLRDVFNFTFIEPYIKLENSYYSDSVESNKLIRQTKQDMLKRFKIRYNSIRPYKFFTYLNDLVNIDCLHKSDSSYIGDDEIFETVSDKRKLIKFAAVYG